MVERIETEDGEVVADDVDVADGPISRFRGLMFRDSVPEGYALVFEFRRMQRVVFHMLFVGFPIDLVFLDDDNHVICVRRLPAWRGLTYEKAKRAIELPSGAADGLEEGEELVFVEN